MCDGQNRNAIRELLLHDRDLLNSVWDNLRTDERQELVKYVVALLTLCVCQFVHTSQLKKTNDREIVASERRVRLKVSNRSKMLAAIANQFSGLIADMEVDERKAFIKKCALGAGQVAGVVCFCWW